MPTTGLAVEQALEIRLGNRSLGTAWAESSEVSIEGSRNSCVQILIEKYFQCLHKPEQRDPDAYLHPLTAVRKRPAA
jgi:hypothetical protein